MARSALTDSGIEPGGCARLMVDEVDLTLGRPRLLPAVGQRSEGRTAGHGGARLAALDGCGHGSDARRRGGLARVLPCRRPRQVAASKQISPVGIIKY